MIANQNHYFVRYMSFETSIEDKNIVADLLSCIELSQFMFFLLDECAQLLFNTQKRNRTSIPKGLVNHLPNECDQYFVGLFIYLQQHGGTQHFAIEGVTSKDGGRNAFEKWMLVVCMHTGCSHLSSDKTSYIVHEAEMHKGEKHIDPRFPKCPKCSTQRASAVEMLSHHIVCCTVNDDENVDKSKDDDWAWVKCPHTIVHTSNGSKKTRMCNDRKTNWGAYKMHERHCHGDEKKKDPLWPTCPKYQGESQQNLCSQRGTALERAG